MEQRIFREGYSHVYTIRSYRQVKADQEPVNRDTHREVDREVYQEADQILLKPSIKRNYEVDRMVSEADFEQRSQSQAASPSQCHLLMATGGEIYHEALHEGSGEPKCN
jgi:hypothetical protein